MKPLPILPMLLLTVTAAAQSSVSHIDQRVLVVDLMMHNAQLTVTTYETPKQEAKEEGSDAVEGGDFVEKISLFTSRNQKALAVYAFLGNYFSTVDSIWYENDNPVYVSTAKVDVMTDTKIFSRAWIYGHTILKYLENDPQSDDPEKMTERRDDLGPRFEALSKRYSRVTALME